MNTIPPAAVPTSLRPYRHSEAVLSLEELAAVGSVAVESTYLEKWLENMIWDLLGLDLRTGPLVTEKMMLGHRIELFADAARKRLPDPSYGDQLAELVRRLRKTQNDRNFVIHGEWATENSGPLASMWGIPRSAAIATKVKKEKLSTFPAKSIQSTVDDLSLLRRDLMYFFVQVWQNTSDPNATGEDGDAANPIPEG